MVWGIDVNFWAVLVASVANIIIGALWYGPLFGKAWMAMMNFQKSDLKSMKLNAATSMVLGFVGALITNYFLAVFIGVTNVSTILSGMAVGFWIWLGFAMPLNAGVFLWEGKSINLFLFNTAQYLISILIASAIIAAW